MPLGKGKVSPCTCCNEDISLVQYVKKVSQQGKFFAAPLYLNAVAGIFKQLVKRTSRFDNSPFF